MNPFRSSGTGDIGRHLCCRFRALAASARCQLAPAKNIIESHRTSLEGLWLELIGRGHLSGQEIADGLRPDEKTDLPTPKTRRKIRQRLHG